MPRTLFAVSLTLALLAGLVPGNALAGPPEGPSGRMVLDEVSEGLRCYRQEADPEKRAAWLKKLAPTRDPRVGVALGQALEDRDRNVALSAAIMLCACFSPDPWSCAGPWRDALAWWRANEADLRRRARELPR